MKIKLNVDWNGAVDGIHIALYPAGASVDFPIQIAAVLLEEGRASLPDEAKALTGAPENKMEKRTPENKEESPGQMRPTHLSGEIKGKGTSTHAGGRKRSS